MDHGSRETTGKEVRSTRETLEKVLKEKENDNKQEEKVAIYLSKAA